MTRAVYNVKRFAASLNKNDDLFDDQSLTSEALAEASGVGRMVALIDDAVRTMPLSGSVSVPAVRLLLTCLHREAANDCGTVEEVANGNHS